MKSTTNNGPKRAAKASEVPTPRYIPFIVTKLRDKGKARELRNQLHDYLRSVVKAEKVVKGWDERVNEIDEEMKELEEGRRDMGGD
eukprot:g8578.t1 g8578   contig3:419938-420286(-)